MAIRSGSHQPLISFSITHHPHNYHQLEVCQNWLSSCSLSSQAWPTSKSFLVTCCSFCLNTPRFQAPFRSLHSCIMCLSASHAHPLSLPLCVPQFLTWSQSTFQKDLLFLPLICSYNTYNYLKLCRYLLKLELWRGRGTVICHMTINFISQFIPQFPEQCLGAKLALFIHPDGMDGVHPLPESICFLRTPTTELFLPTRWNSSWKTRCPLCS